MYRIRSFLHVCPLQSSAKVGSISCAKLERWIFHSFYIKEEHAFLPQFSHSASVAHWKVQTLIAFCSLVWELGWDPWALSPLLWGNPFNVCCRREKGGRYSLVRSAMVHFKFNEGKLRDYYDLTVSLLLSAMYAKSSLCSNFYTTIHKRGFRLHLMNARLHVADGFKLGIWGLKSLS